MRLALRFISGKYQGGEFPLEDNREIINEFLIESYENIGRLDQEFVALEMISVF